MANTDKLLFTFVICNSKRVFVRIHIRSIRDPYPVDSQGRRAQNTKIMIKVLALSSSRVGSGGFLETAGPYLASFLGREALNIAFIPFASVEKDAALYGNRVQEALGHLPYKIWLASPQNGREIIASCDAILVGGGNTFKLLHDLYEKGLMDSIRRKVSAGTPYIGWSAGANISGKTICTTNDMPIIQPRSFDALGFLPFQINPHYLNEKPDNHNGETRDQRLSEFVQLNPGVPVVGLPEGGALELQHNQLRFTGSKTGVLFRAAADGTPQRTEIEENEDLSYLM